MLASPHEKPAVSLIVERTVVPAESRSDTYERDALPGAILHDPARDALGVDGCAYQEAGCLTDNDGSEDQWSPPDGCPESYNLVPDGGSRLQRGCYQPLRVHTMAMPQASGDLDEGCQTACMRSAVRNSRGISDMSL